MAATILQLDPPLPLETPKGRGLAQLVIDYGPEHNLMWTVFIDDTGECWTFENPQIRACSNYTLGRVSPRLADLHPPALKNGAVPGGRRAD